MARRPEAHRRRRVTVILSAYLPAVAFACMPVPGMGATIFADAGIPADCRGGYDPASRLCGAGDAVAYRTIKSASDAARAGDNVVIRGGTYGEPLVPSRSGNQMEYITYTNHPGETVVISRVDGPAVFLLNRKYLIIENLNVTDSLGWGRIEGSSNVIIRNNRFARAVARGTTGGLKYVKSDSNKIINNHFEAGNDSLVLQESDRNIVEGNTFANARHSLLSIRCGNFNMIRGNRFHNPRQKACEVYDCEGVSDAPVKLDATKRNVFDGNVFSSTKAADRDYRYNGIQYAGQYGIVRRNVFYDNHGGAINFQVYPKESLYNYGHRVYNNTFFNNRCHAVSASSSTGFGRYYGNIVTNNIFYANVACNGGANQTSIGNSKAVMLDGNAVVKISPLFVDEAGRDLSLAPGSPMIDAGAFATRAAGNGSGRSMAVEDASYFQDGFGIAGEHGDEIQLEGQTETARIVSIDYSKNILSLDRSLTWGNGQKLHLKYSGNRPDMGAFEYSNRDKLSAPSGLNSNDNR